MFSKKIKLIKVVLNIVVVVVNVLASNVTGKQLGSGAFGVVMKAEAYELEEPGVATTVAVKMVKRNSEVDTIKALASELKIMIHLGKHLNVVNVLGACTGSINKSEFNSILS